MHDFAQKEQRPPRPMSLVALKPSASVTAAHSPDLMQRLQRSIGNQGVLRMLQVHAVTPQPGFGTKGVKRQGSVYEREGDRVAKQLMRMTSQIQRQPSQRTEPREPEAILDVRWSDDFEKFYMRLKNALLGSRGFRGIDPRDYEYSSNSESGLRDTVERIHMQYSMHHLDRKEDQSIKFKISASYNPSEDFPLTHKRVSIVVEPRAEEAGSGQVPPATKAKDSSQAQKPEPDEEAFGDIALSGGSVSIVTWYQRPKSDVPDEQTILQLIRNEVSSGHPGREPAEDSKAMLFVKPPGGKWFLHWAYHWPWKEPGKKPACFDGKTVTVTKNGQSVSCPAITSSDAPTPEGQFCVRQQGEAQRESHWYRKSHSRWYLLEPQFETTRSRMDLHPGSVSKGCVTVTDSTCFGKMQTVLNSGGREAGFGYDGYPPGNSDGVKNPRKDVDCVAILSVSHTEGACDR
jgi:hypothetical protein